MTGLINGYPGPLYRVVPLENGGTTAGLCQVQVLEPNARGEYSVTRVWPGDAAHLELWNSLMSGKDGGEDSGQAQEVEARPAGGA